MISMAAREACVAINDTLGQFRALRAAIALTDLRDAWPALVNESSLGLNSISGIIAHTELYVTECASRAVEVGIKNAPQAAMKAIMSGERKRYEGTWPARVEVLKTWAGISISQWTHWQIFDGYVNARNAWAHGRGQLTRQQLSKPDVAQALARAGLSVENNVVVVDSVSVSNCASTATALVRFVDDQMMNWIDPVADEF